MQWIAVFTITNPYYDTKTLVIDTIYPSKNKLAQDILNDLSTLTGAFKDYRPHPDDRYEICPTQLKDNKLQKLERKVGGFLKREVVYQHTAEGIFKWNVPIEQVREHLQPCLTKEEKRLQYRLAKQLFRNATLPEDSDWYDWLHQIGGWIFGLVRLGLPALIEDMKKEEEERRNLFMGPKDDVESEEETTDAAAE